METNNYQLIKTEGLVGCPQCNGHNVYLLCPIVFSKELPAFYICDDCDRVAQVGVGEVLRPDVLQEIIVAEHLRQSYVCPACSGSGIPPEEDYDEINDEHDCLWCGGTGTFR